MSRTNIKKSLLEIANRVTPSTTLEEVYEPLAMLSDIELSESQEKDGKVLSNAEVKRRSKKWLK